MFRMKRLQGSLSLIILLALFVPAAVFAAPGDLDTTFNAPNGYIEYYNGSPVYGRATAVQPDGKIVVAGTVTNNYDVLVMRYNSDGTLDQTFGSGGIVTYDGGPEDYGYSVAIQTDGKIVVAGTTYSNNNYTVDVLVLRYNSNGTLDSTFGSGGVATYDGGFHDYVLSVAVQPDGKIAVAGYAYNNNDNDVLVLRYNSNGTLDPAFGSGGVVIYDGGYYEHGLSIAVQPDGKIVVAGNTYNNINYDVLVRRYNNDGTPDQTFGSGGLLTYNGGYDDFGYSVAIQPDGKIVVAGRTNNGNNDDLLLLRCNSNGTPDQTFGSGGVATYNGGYNEAGNAVAFQSDGKIVVAGIIFNNTIFNLDVLVLRYNNDGTLDQTFGSSGVATYSGGPYDFGNSVAIQPDGKIVVAGESNNGFLVLRLLGGGGSQVLFSDSMEAGVNGWTVEGGLWHLVGPESPYAQAYSPTHSWWYGQESTGNFDTPGSANSGRLVSPSIDLTGVTTASLSFQSWYETETTGTGYDQRWVQIKVGEGGWQPLVQLSGDNMQTWDHKTIDLTTYAGNVVQIGFFFDTRDDWGNAYRGWYIDDVQVAGSASGGGGGWVVHSTDGIAAIDWSTTQHGPASVGNYIRLGTTYYYVGYVDTCSSWSGCEYHMAALQQCDQTTGAPLTDGSGNPLWAPLSPGVVGMTIELFTTWPGGGGGWVVSSIIETGGSAIDWLSSQHVALNVGEYVRLGSTYYYVTYSGCSWRGCDYNGAMLQQCDQGTGAPLTDGGGSPLWASLSPGVVGMTIELFTTWPGGGGGWVVYSTDGYSAIDWSTTQHGPLNVGNYVRLGTTYYYVGYVDTCSWNGCNYHMVVLQQCDQVTGVPLGNAPLSPSLVGMTIELFTTWPGGTGAVSEDFETGGLTNLPWYTYGDGQWYATVANSHGGNLSAQAPSSLLDSQMSTIEISRNIQSGNVTFWYSVDSEQGWDYLRFYIDGVMMEQWSGQVSWTQASFPVSSGVHTFRWEYSKDGSVSTGADTAWIDDISFPPPLVSDYTVNTTAGPGGAINPAGPIEVPAGSSPVFDIIPDPGYGVINVEVNGISMGSVYSVTLNNVNADQNIYASFGLVPANDNCSSSTEVTGINYSDSVNTEAASSAVDEPVGYTGTKYRTVWYRFTPPVNGSITVNTFGSSYDTVLTAYTGGCGAFTLVTGNDDTSGLQSQVTLNVTGGTTYYFMVSSYGTYGGNMIISSSYFPSPQQLTVSRTGTSIGNVTSAPAGIDLTASQSATAMFAYNTSVTLTAIPGPNSIFTGWSGACTGTGGCVVTMDYDKNVTASFAPAPVSNATIMPNLTSPQLAGTNVSFTANGIGGSGSYEYKFLLNSGTGYTTVQNYSTSNAWTWYTMGFNAGTTYNVMVYVRNAGSVATYEASTTISYTLNLAPPTVTTNLPSPQNIGTSYITFSAFEPGGGSYLYKFDLGSTTRQNYSTNNTWTWNTAGVSAGTYSITVYVKNTSSTDAYQALTTINYTLRIAPPTFTTNLVSPQPGGTNIVFTANEPGGGTYEYKFFLNSGSGYTVVQNYSTSNVWTWNTGSYAPGNYGVMVYVRNVGTSTPYEAYKAMQFSLTTPTVSTVTLTPNLTSPRSVGTSVIFTAGATGGTGNYEYKFLLNQSGTYTQVQAYSASNTWTWNTGSYPTGNYGVMVYVRNAGSYSPYEGYKAIQFVITIPTVSGATITPNLATPQSAGTNVIFTAGATGGTGNYEYRFLLNQSGTYTQVQAYSASNSWTWNTGSYPAGNYGVMVYVRNVGSTAPYEAFQAMQFTISTVPVSGATISPSLASPRPVGTSVVFTAGATGGTGNYEYKFLLNLSGTYIQVQAYSASNTWTWNTGLYPAGNYGVMVYVRNAWSTAPYEAYQFMQYTLQ